LAILFHVNNIPGSKLVLLTHSHSLCGSVFKASFAEFLGVVAHTTGGHSSDGLSTAKFDFVNLFLGVPSPTSLSMRIIIDMEMPDNVGTCVE
jgi:hypothetical protein